MRSDVRDSHFQSRSGRGRIDGDSRPLGLGAGQSMKVKVDRRGVESRQSSGGKVPASKGLTLGSPRESADDCVVNNLIRSADGKDSLQPPRTQGNLSASRPAASGKNSGNQNERNQLQDPTMNWLLEGKIFSPRMVRTVLELTATLGLTTA